DFQTITLEVAKEVSGVVVFFGNRPAPESLEKLSLSRELVQTVASFIQLQNRMHSVSVKDETPEALNRGYFLATVKAEIMRCHALEHPISLLMIAVESYGAAVNEGGLEEGHSMLRLLARVLQKHARVNDILARTGSDEFAILLPDTNLEGAAIKAERLRRMI